MRSLLAYYADAVMAAAVRGTGCAEDCSGHGDCMNGTCLCEIRYSGEVCAGHNLPYHACIGGVFLLVAFVCAVQLTICVVTEYRRLKAPTFLRACKVTTQKMLYLVAFLAALIRGAYFVSPSAFQKGWTTSLLSAYYPLLMSGSSLIVCFWAECWKAVCTVCLSVGNAPAIAAVLWMFMAFSITFTSYHHVARLLDCRLFTSKNNVC